MLDSESTLNAVTLTRRAVSALQQEQYANARDLFDRALTLCQTDCELLYGKAVACLRLGLADEASSIVTELLELAPHHSGAKRLSNEISLTQGTAGEDTAKVRLDQLRPVLKVIQGYNILELTAAIDLVRGFLSHREGATLYMLAAEGPAKGQIVEIGSFMGRSTIWLAHGSKQCQREKVFAVDPHTGSPEHQADGELADWMPESGSTHAQFISNATKFEVDDWITPLVMTSEQAAASWRDPIRLLFIDADHSLEMVTRDFELWEPFVAENGIIAFHDVRQNNGAPYEFIKRNVQNSLRFREVTLTDSLYSTQKLY